MNETFRQLCIGGVSFGWYWRICGTPEHTWKLAKDLAKLADRNYKRQLCDSKTEKIAKKKLSNKKKLSKIDCRKHNFSSNTKIFARENLILMNESIADNCCKLKHNRLIYGCFSRDGIIRIKREERARPVKIFHMDKLHQLFPHFDFGDVDMTFF